VRERGREGGGLGRWVRRERAMRLAGLGPMEEKRPAGWALQNERNRGEKERVGRMGYVGEKEKGRKRRKWAEPKEKEREEKKCIQMHLNLNLKFKFKWKTSK
jgi:hypothetical protein